MGNLRETLSAILDPPVYAAATSATGLGLGNRLYVVGHSTPRYLLPGGWQITKTRKGEDASSRRRARGGRVERPDLSLSRGKPHVSNEGDGTRAFVERARSGDSEAFASLFDLHGPTILRLCRRMLEDSSSAEDAASEVFLRARRSLATYDSDKEFLPWLRAIASNHCIDQLRRRQMEQSLFRPVDLTIDEPADQAPNALLGLTHRQERSEVLEALDRLPAKYRLPLVLRFYRDLDYTAIGEILGVTRNQVGTLLFRAKRMLRGELAADGSQGDLAPRRPTDFTDPSDSEDSPRPGGAKR